ncbi:hypothetical protein I317_01334 [Kwoniella heveanensis CBS 569]|nr:hypothetical protein I317_01334 [Kwoniella heveanensis CBS 569]
MSALTTEELYNQAIFAALHSTPRTITWYCALGAGFEGLVLGAILTQVYRYYEHFHLQDARVTLFLVGVGTVACLGQFAVNLWQAYMFIDKAATTVNSIIIKDVYADMVVLIFTGLFNLAAVTYFSKRAIKLVGKARLFAPLLGFLGIASFAMCIACVCSGFNLPHNPAELQTWIARVNRYVIAWTAVALLTDICVCVAMTYALLKCRDEIKAAATSLFRKLLMLTFETMLPPALVTFLLLVFGGIATATMGNFSRVLVWCIGPLYFHAILHSLVGRQDVQFILQKGAGQSSNSAGGRNTNQRAMTDGYANDSLGNAGMRAELGLGMQMVPVSEHGFGGRTKNELGLNDDDYEYKVNLS